MRSRKERVMLSYHTFTILLQLIFWFFIVAAPVVWLIERKNRKTCKRP